jgi:hypothetical protein
MSYGINKDQNMQTRKQVPEKIVAKTLQAEVLA